MTACAGGDPLCPCQDGDPCHYRPMPGSYAAELEKLHADLATIYAEGGAVVRWWVRWLRWRLARLELHLADTRDRALARYFRS